MSRQASEEERLDFVKHLLRAAALIRRHTTAALKALKLTPEEWLVMEALDAATLSQGELADATLRDRPTLTRACDALEKAKLLVRTAHPDDRRVVQLKLSPRGREVLARARPAVAKATASWTQGLAKKEAEAGYAAFRAVHELVWDP